MCSAIAVEEAAEGFAPSNRLRACTVGVMKKLPLPL